MLQLAEELNEAKVEERLNTSNQQLDVSDNSKSICITKCFWLSGEVGAQVENGFTARLHLQLSQIPGLIHG